MKQIGLFLLFLSCFFSFVHAAHPVKEKVVTVVYADYWKPYSYISANGEVKGILVEVMDEILSKKLNMKVKHTGQPWKRAQNSVRGGFQDAMITAPTTSRLKYSQSTSNNLYYLQWRVFVSKKSLNYHSIMKMKDPLKERNLSFISLLGDRTSERLYENNDIKYKSVKDISNAIKMLDLGRVDIFIHSKIIMFEHLNKMNLNKNISMHDKEYKSIAFTFLVSQKSAFYDDLIFKIDEVVNEMKANNTYKKFIEDIEQNNLELGE